MITLKLRVLPRSEIKDLLRIYLPSALMQSAGLKNGSCCLLRISNTCSVSAIAWFKQELQGNSAQASSMFASLYGLKNGNELVLEGQSELLEAQNVVLRHIRTKDSEEEDQILNQDYLAGWEFFMKVEVLRRAEFLCIGMILEDIQLGGRKWTWVVAQVNGISSDTSIFRSVEASGTVKIISEAEAESTSLLITKGRLGGLDRQLEQLQRRIRSYQHDVEQLAPVLRYERKGILLYGPSGTGKSMVLSRVENAGWRSTFRIGNADLTSRTMKPPRLRSLVDSAMRKQPSILILDELETAVSLDELQRSFETIRGHQVLILGATLKLEGLDSRILKWFSSPIEVTAPDSHARLEILNGFFGKDVDSPTSTLKIVAERTHGYTGADLCRLAVCASEYELESRRLSRDTTSNGFHNDIGSSGVADRIADPFEPAEEDFFRAFQEIRPTVMQEVFVETPVVTWSDIGGQNEIKKTLIDTIEAPLKHSKLMKALDETPMKGLLMYGPPGCSKTLTAQALANSSGLNFLAVKGAELLSKYVGDSEKKLRDIFAKARAAAPSILFFDEIDAIGADRDGGDPGVHLLTTLLNELDGIEALEGVFVLAATNKQSTLDPALMRPGRLDSLVYVGPPNFDARREIFKLHTDKVKDAGLLGDVDLDALAQDTDGFSGAEVVSICRKAKAKARADIINTVTTELIMKHFRDAKNEVLPQITTEMLHSYTEWRRKQQLLL